MTRFVSALVFVLACVATVPAFAQTVDVPAGVPLTLQADQPDPSNTAEYRVYLCPGAGTDCLTQQGAARPLSSRSSTGLVSLAVPAQVRGTYAIQMAACNLDGGCAKSPALIFRAVSPLPQAPSNIRLVAVTQSADGTLGIQLLDVNQVRAELQLAPIGLTPAPEVSDPIVAGLRNVRAHPIETLSPLTLAPQVR